MQSILIILLFMIILIWNNELSCVDYCTQLSILLVSHIQYILFLPETIAFCLSGPIVCLSRGTQQAGLLRKLRHTELDSPGGGASGLGRSLLGEEELCRVHDRAYVEAVLAMDQRGERGEEARR